MCENVANKNQLTPEKAANLYLEASLQLDLLSMTQS